MELAAKMAKHKKICRQLLNNISRANFVFNEILIFYSNIFPVLLICPCFRRQRTKNYTFHFTSASPFISPRIASRELTAEVKKRKRNARNGKKTKTDES